MYKRFNIEELVKIKNNFIQNLANLIAREKAGSLKELLKVNFSMGNSVYFFSKSLPIWTFTQKEDFTKLIDEVEMIEFDMDQDNYSKINTLIKNYMLKKSHRDTDAKTIQEILGEEFKKGIYSEILGKPYLVYDIETTSNVQNLKKTKFLIGYVAYPQSDGRLEYEYISQDGLNDFVQKMIDFDGYIIGFNQIWFDNPVCIYNSTKSDQDLEILNKKSLDIFLFLWAITGKRIGLNKVSQSLVGIEKTLESGVEGEVLRKKYQETGEVTFLNQFKKYCKNDVKMTTLVLLYLLHFKKVFREGEEISYTIQDFIKKSKERRNLDNDDLVREKTIFE